MGLFTNINYENSISPCPSKMHPIVLLTYTGGWHDTYVQHFIDRIGRIQFQAFFRADGTGSYNQTIIDM